jgi:4-hydroxybenzoate polyprenyltransferase
MFPRIRSVALAAVCLGVGILMACFLPAQVLVVIAAAAIIIVGFLCMKC